MVIDPRNVEFSPEESAEASWRCPFCNSTFVCGREGEHKKGCLNPNAEHNTYRYILTPYVVVKLLFNGKTAEDFSLDDFRKTDVFKCLTRSMLLEWTRKWKTLLMKQAS